jgi:hypothetical protein
MTEERVSGTPAGNLTAALVTVAFLELLLNRLAARLFLPGSSIAGERLGSPAARVLIDMGPFLSHLTGVLAFLVLIAAFAGLLRRGELFPRAMRVAVIVIALVFWVIGGLAVLLGHVQSEFFLYLAISFAFLSLLIAASLLGSGARPRVKLGVALFALPGVLHVLSMVGERAGWLRASGALDLSRMGEVLLLTASVTAPLLLAPRSLAERAWRLPLATAALVTVLFAVVLVTRYDLVQASGLYGLRLEIPHLDSPLGIAYLLALFGWVCMTTQLLAEPGGLRLAGYGLLLLAIAGYQAASPVELGLSLVGLLALSVGQLRAIGASAAPAAAQIGRAEWRAYVGRLRTALADGTSPEDLPPDAVVVEEGDIEVSRIRAHRRGQPISLRLLRRRAALVELDVTVGQPSHGGPDASIERHRRWLARSPGERVKLPRAKTGDPVFDQKFSVHGQAPLADGDLRRRLARQQGDGQVSVWRRSAARYVVSSPANGDGAPAPFTGMIESEAAVSSVVELVDTLADLIDASAPESA